MRVLVTGTSKGIGRAIALKFLKEGHEVIGFDVLDSSINEDNYHHYMQDVSKELIDLDNIEIVINNAGIQSQSLEDINVNLIGAMNVTEKYAFTPSIKSVLFVASSSGSTGAEFKEYVASKGGLIAYSKNVASRVAKFGATCNSISPGGVITSLNEHILESKELYKAVLDETTLGKWASVEEIAEWAYFLTVINKSMTGQDLLIDNGEAGKFNFIW